MKKKIAKEKENEYRYAYSMAVASICFACLSILAFVCCFII